MSNNSKKKVFLTGSSGFIGKNILELLGNTYEFITPSHVELDLLNTDDVFHFLQNHPVDLIVHGANKGGSRREKNLPHVAVNNLRIFFNLTRARQFYKRMIVLGSGAEYDKSFPVISAKESDFGKRIPSDEYGFYKYACSIIAEKDNDITHLRLFGVYGKYEDYQTRFISNAICRALHGMPITLNQNVKFDYMYVRDTVNVIQHFIEHTGGERIYNVGSGKPIELKDVAAMIANKLKVPLIIKEGGLGREYSCDISRLIAEMGQVPYTPLEKSINELIDYYTSVKSTINSESLFFD